MTLVYLIAGEASGDALGGRLMTALRARRPGLRFAGIGGPAMQAQGLESLFPMNELALMGLLEVVPRLIGLRRRIRQTEADIAARRPAVLVTIDSPGFTLRILKSAAALGMPRAHYVAPQAWAWRESRVRHYPGLWDALLCLLPFEPAFFARHGLAARFVGHPVLESGADRGDAARFRARHGIAADAVPLILMPGSRRTETGPLLPILGRALELLHPLVPGLLPVVPVAPGVAEAVRAGTEAWRTRPILVSEPADKYDAFAAAAAALTKSGTTTLELALAGVPMTVAYKVNPLTAFIARRVVKVRYASILNLIADRAVIPELIQQDCTPGKLAATLAPLLTDPAAADAQRAALRPLLAALRPPTGLPSEAAAAAVLSLLDGAGPDQAGSNQARSNQAGSDEARGGQAGAG
jgi:lipid-A-disaccharide synthase